MGLGSVVYSVYERQLSRTLRGTPIPRHIAVILDGNRRWAKSTGRATDHGHKRGADKITEVLEWSHEEGVEVVTLWMLSTDNLQRDPEELTALLDIIVGAVEGLAEDGRWRLRHVGDQSLLPTDAAERIERAVAHTANVDGLHVNIAIGYGGRHEIAGAVKGYLQDAAAHGKSIEETAAEFSIDSISERVYTKGQPDPDLVIRTSGEQRLSGFLMWQSAHSEFYFCDAYWPAFRRIDFLRALRSFSQRQRRMGR